MSYTLTDTILYVENLSVAYDGKVVIKDITFEEKNVVRENKITGQTIAFVGRSGRGKSTLFKALTGIIKPTSGRILISDVTSSLNNSAKEVKEGDVGFVNQKYTLFRNKTVHEAFLFSLRKKKLTGEAKEALILHYLSTWDLEECKHKYPCELSGGQRQRTAIIEQILSSDYYMILDEPFSGLDVGNIENVKEAFQLISSEHDLNTIIFSTHDIELAVELADSIYIIGYPSVNGKKADYGTIVKHIDMKKNGLSWNTFGAEHLAVVNEIKTTMLQS
jgi:ABC-type multidrug transport system ATPase subunit